MNGHDFVILEPRVVTIDATTLGRETIESAKSLGGFPVIISLDIQKPIILSPGNI